MANSYVSTDSSSLGGTAGAAGLVQKAYDRLLEFALRAQPLIRDVADKRPAKQAIPGSTVVLQRYVDLSAATTALTETADPDAVAMTTPTSVTITLNEYGNAVLVTRALELFSLADVDPAIANIIACLVFWSRLPPSLSSRARSHLLPYFLPSSIVLSSQLFERHIRKNIRLFPNFLHRAAFFL